jgi:hypothetical protein
MFCLYYGVLLFMYHIIIYLFHNLHWVRLGYANAVQSEKKSVMLLCHVTSQLGLQNFHSTFLSVT